MPLLFTGAENSGKTDFMGNTENSGKSEINVGPTVDLTREDILKEAAAYLGDFGSPTGTSQSIPMTTRVSQATFIRVAQLQATLRVNADPMYTEGQVLDTALLLLERFLIKQGYEIEPVSKKRYDQFKQKSLAIKQAAVDRKAKNVDKAIKKVKTLIDRSPAESKNKIEALIAKM